MSCVSPTLLLRSSHFLCALQQNRAQSMLLYLLIISCFSFCINFIWLIKMNDFCLSWVILSEIRWCWSSFSSCSSTKIQAILLQSWNCHTTYANHYSLTSSRNCKVRRIRVHWIWIFLLLIMIYIYRPMDSYTSTKLMQYKIFCEMTANKSFYWWNIL